MMKRILLFSVSILIALNTKAQLTTTAEADDLTFIYSLAGPGITVTDAVRTCAENASGYFNSADANVGIENGMLLTTGSIAGAQGPNNQSGTTTANGTAGDADLEDEVLFMTFDACVIEFDMTVMADTLRLDYVFGSEEYLEFAGSSFNDIFAFYLSGPGIADPVNIALVPGTADAVAINNINTLVNPAYYVDNGDGFMAPYSTDPFYIQYDGMTTLLEAFSLVTAGETYHMKIAIADAGDGVLDSGVFLETGSLGSLRLKHEVTVDLGADYAVEKCANGYFTFINEVPSDEPLILDFHIEGSATNGVDYEMIPDQLIIPAGESFGTIEIAPLHDAVFESLESVVLYLYNPQSGFIYDTVSMLINDELEATEFDAANDELTYYFTDLSPTATGWSWDFGDDETSVEQNPVHTYATDGEYEVCLMITDEVGCNDEYCKTVVAGSVGISDQNAAQFTITTNPVSDLLEIQMANPGLVIIRNIMGQVVYQEHLAQTTVHVETSGFAKGVYFVEVRNGIDSMVQQVVKL